MPLRTFARAAAALLIAAGCLPAHAEDAYPSAHPIEWVVPYPAGGGSDIVARYLQEDMSKFLGQSIIINNKPGAATAIGAEYTARAKPDGYTILSGDTATLAANPPLYPHLPYDPQRDFIAVSCHPFFSLNGFTFSRLARRMSLAVISRFGGAGCNPAA